VQTRRDQLHAYRFLTRRAMSALVTGEPDTVEPPMRRLTVTTISGIMVAIVVAAAVAVIALIRPGGGNDWQEDGTVVAARETGALYLMIDGRLHPVLNYPSAVLASGKASEVEVELVSRSDIASVDPGPAIGILGLPNSVPASSELVSGPVTVCSQAVADGVDVTTEVSLDVGNDRASEAVGDDEAVYVESFDDQRFLLWRGERHLISRNVANVLGINARPVRVGRAFLTAVPQGAPFATPEVAGVGEQPAVPGAGSLLVGQVIEVSDGSFRVLLRDGIASVTDIQARLLLTSSADAEERTMSLSEVSRIPESTDEADALAQETSGLPATLTALSEAALTACAVYDGGETTPTLAVPAGAAPSTEPTEEGAQSRRGLADVVRIEPGVGVLAQAPQGTAVSLLAEPGLRHPAADLATLAGFGYGDADPVRLPAELLTMIPTGPALDPEAARLPATGAEAALDDAAGATGR
jgi:type VII secretion protein EccB